MRAGEVVTLIADMAEAAGDEVHARQAEMNIHRPDLRSLVSTSQRPILALAGEDDRVCPRERYLDLQRAPNAALKIVESAGPFLPLEAPVACAEDRTSVVSGKRVSVRVDLGGRRIIKKK